MMKSDHPALRAGLVDQTTYGCTRTQSRYFFAWHGFRRPLFDAILCHLARMARLCGKMANELGKLQLGLIVICLVRQACSVSSDTGVCGGGSPTVGTVPVEEGERDDAGLAEEPEMSASVVPVPR